MEFDSEFQWVQVRARYYSRMTTEWWRLHDECRSMKIIAFSVITDNFTAPVGSVLEFAWVVFYPNRASQLAIEDFKSTGGRLKMHRQSQGGQLNPTTVEKIQGNAKSRALLQSDDFNDQSVQTLRARLNSLAQTKALWVCGDSFVEAGTLAKVVGGEVPWAKGELLDWNTLAWAVSETPNELSPLDDFDGMQRAATLAHNLQRISK